MTETAFKTLIARSARQSFGRIFDAQAGGGDVTAAAQAIGMTVAGGADNNPIALTEYCANHRVEALEGTLGSQMLDDIPSFDVLAHPADTRRSDPKSKDIPLQLLYIADMASRLANAGRRVPIVATYGKSRMLAPSQRVLLRMALTDMDDEGYRPVFFRAEGRGYGPQDQCRIGIGWVDKDIALPEGLLAAVPDDDPMAVAVRSMPKRLWKQAFWGRLVPPEAPLATLDDILDEFPEEHLYHSPEKTQEIVDRATSATAEWLTHSIAVSKEAGGVTRACGYNRGPSFSLRTAPGEMPPLNGASGSGSMLVAEVRDGHLRTRGLSAAEHNRANFRPDDHRIPLGGMRRVAASAGEGTMRPMLEAALRQVVVPLLAASTR